MIVPHGHLSFFKYITASTGMAILENSSFRWSNPDLFNKYNDKFDVPRVIAEGISSSDLEKARVKRITELLSEPLPEDVSHFNDPTKLLIELRRRIPTALVPEFLAQIPNLDHGADSAQPIAEVNILWKKLRRDLRILCLSVSPNLDSMWLHYAENHAGMVIEVSCLPIFDSVWLAAREVIYTDEPRALTTAEGWADVILHDTNKAISRMFDDYILKKSRSWASEEEYRVITYKNSDNGEQHSDMHFHPFHFSAIYLGAEMEAADRNEVAKLARARYPWVKVIQAKLGNTRIQFDPA